MALRLLIVKLSSMGDVVHALPALSDAAHALPDLQVDWLVESGFAAIPARHPAVSRVIPVALRQWRKHPLDRSVWAQMRAIHAALRAHPYDLILDAQGLYKSAFLARLGQGPVVGLAYAAAREPLASSAYHRRVDVPRSLHAVERLRRLFAEALGYDLPVLPADYGLPGGTHSDPQLLVFLHGTTWASKHYPVHAWQALIGLAEAQGYRVALPWGNTLEKARADQLAQASQRAHVLPALTLDGLMDVLSAAAGVITVDSGLGHLACALGRPVIGIYGATDSARTGLNGGSSINLRADLACSPCMKRDCHRLSAAGTDDSPCYATIHPERIWSQLQILMDRAAPRQNGSAT
jgi:heptosyltransferase-1